MGGKINAMDDKIGAMGGSKIRWGEEIPDGKNKKVDGRKKPPLMGQLFNY